MRRCGFAGVSALFCIVFLLLSCDIDPMDAIIQDPVTVRFYNGEALFREVTVERGADVPMPSTNPNREGHDFLHWYRTTSGGEERRYAEHGTLRTEGMPSNLDTVALYARFMNVAFQHEVSGVSHSMGVYRPPDTPPQVPDHALFQTITFTWTNPTDADFSHIRIFNGWQALGDDRYVAESEPGATYVTFIADWVILSPIFRLRTVDVHGNLSHGIWYEVLPDNNPDW